MSEQAKTIVAYVVGLSVLLLAWSYVRTWEPPVPVPVSVNDATAIAAPDRAAIPPAVPVARK